MRNYCVFLFSLIPLLSLASCESDNDDIHNYDEIKDDKKDLLSIMNNDSTNICTTTNQYDVLNISWYMKQNSRGSVQGAAIYGDYMFQFQNELKNVYIYNLRIKKHISTIELSSNSLYHCNNANFSTQFYSDSDLFPLIYVSQQNNKVHQVLVYRIIGDSIENLSLNLVQIIAGPSPTTNNHMFAQDCILDNDNNYLYIYAHHKRDDLNSFHIVKYKLPDINEPTVELNDDYLYSSVFYNNQFSSPQGAVCHNGLLYFIKGVPSWKENVLLNIVDFDKKEVCTINLTEKGFKKEPEGLFFYEDHLFFATNNGGIYSLNLVDNNSQQK